MLIDLVRRDIKSHTSGLNFGIITRLSGRQITLYLITFLVRKRD